MLTASEILQMVAEKHKVPWQEFFREPIHDRGRCPIPQPVATAKAEAAWELRARLNLSYPQLARTLRLRSHASALWLCRQHERRQQKAAADRHYAAMCELIGLPGITTQSPCKCGSCSKCRNRTYKRRWTERQRPENQSVSIINDLYAISM
jgi:hypothetical protein